MKQVAIFYGSRIEFEKIIPKVDCCNLTDIVMEIDTDSRSFILEIPDTPIQEKEKTKVINFVVYSDEYAGVREHVILNFANFLSKMDVINLFLQNPPLSISNQIIKLFPQTEIIKQQYRLLKKSDLMRIYESYEDKIKGQNKVRKKLLQALFPLTSGKRKKPVVILFYGNTGLGKTETAQLICNIIGENLFRKQFSMFQNNQFATYLFGGTHYERSFAKELLERESNVILLDEFDKANSTFHSAFYQLFDEGIYEDQNYHLDLQRSIIICTSNYKSENNIKTHLGTAIFSRFDAIIKFDDLSVCAKSQIANLQYESKLYDYSDEEQGVIISAGIKEELVKLAGECNNAREISHLVEQTFSLILINNMIGEKT